MVVNGYDWGMALSVSGMYYQIIYAILMCASLAFFFSKTNSKKYERILYWFLSIPLIYFVIFREFGIGRDDSMYYGVGSTDDFIQRGRDWGWYAIVYLIRKIYPYPQVVLLVSGISFIVKLIVIDRLCVNKCLALGFYLALFYPIHDVTALRVSSAIGIYLLGFCFLLRGVTFWGGVCVVGAGVFHKQALFSLITLFGHNLVSSPHRLFISLFLPLGLLLINIYPDVDIFNIVREQSWGNSLLDMLFGATYVKRMFAGEYVGRSIMPIVVPPTLFLSTFLLSIISEERIRLYKLVASNLVLAVWLLWFYAANPEVQLRFWDFFLVPIVFIVGVTPLTLLRYIFIFLLSVIYVLKYIIIGGLLAQPVHVKINGSHGGVVESRTKGIPCGFTCGIAYSSGDTVNFVAKPDRSFRLVDWGGICDAAINDKVCSVSVERDIVVTPVFHPTLTFSVNVSGFGSVVSEDAHISCGLICGVHFDVGSSIRIRAQPEYGYRFAGWGGACEGDGAYCELKLYKDSYVDAYFEKM